MLSADMVYVDQLDVRRRELVNVSCFHLAGPRVSRRIAVGEPVDFDFIADYVERLSRPEPIVADDLAQLRRARGPRRSCVTSAVSGACWPSA